MAVRNLPRLCTAALQKPLRTIRSLTLVSIRLCPSVWSIERYSRHFSLFERGVMGTFHNMGRQHIDRYLNEFSFRWNNREVDAGALLARVVRGSEGMRLTYLRRRAEERGVGRPVRCRSRP
jgi:ISXO2-like transposase domain